jgi:uncharacterized protein (DUF1778 family)
MNYYYMIAQKKLVLSDRDRDLFLSKIENPPALQGTLKLAIEKYLYKYKQS